MTRMGSSIHTYIGDGTRNRYTSMELRRGNFEWEELATSFTHTFEFASDHLTIDVELQIMKENIFYEIPVAATNFD